MLAGRGGRRRGGSGGVAEAGAKLLPAGIRGVGEVSLHPRGNSKKTERNSREHGSEKYKGELRLAAPTTPLLRAARGPIFRCVYGAIYPDYRLPLPEAAVR